MTLLLILWCSVLAVLLSWGYSDHKRREVSDKLIIPSLIAYGIVYILALFFGAVPVYYIFPGMLFFALFMIAYRGQVKFIDSIAVMITAIAFPVISLGAMGIYLIMHIADIKKNGKAYYSAFIMKFFIAFVVASLLAIPFLLHWYSI